MVYQKIINFLDNTPNKSTKFRIKNCVKINHDLLWTYNTNSQTKFKTSVLKSSLLVTGTISIANTVTKGAASNNNDKQVAFKNCFPFTDCIIEINSTQVDNAKDVDVLISMYNLIWYNDNDSKTVRRLWQYYRDEPLLTTVGFIDNFPDNSASFRFKQKLTG